MRTKSNPSLKGAEVRISREARQSARSISVCERSFELRESQLATPQRRLVLTCFGRGCQRRNLQE
jgi:hypothetical protein